MTCYRAIVADPPWPIRWTTGKTRVNGRRERHRVLKRELAYPTMSIEAIAELNVGGLAEDDAHLYLWAPDRFLIDGTAARIAEAWGFRPLRMIVWAKKGFGLGRFPRPAHEVMLVCERGHLAFRVFDAPSVQWWTQPYLDGTRLHSGKPAGALDLIERASPGPYLELFARTQRLGWDTWGDEALEHVQIPAPTRGA